MLVRCGGTKVDFCLMSFHIGGSKDPKSRNFSREKWSRTGKTRAFMQKKFSFEEINALHGSFYRIQIGCVD